MQSEPARPRMRVLVAEDNAVMQSVLKFMLVSWGYEPVIASDGAEAWKILQSDSAPRIAILDWIMPGMDGLEICRRVRAAGSGAVHLRCCSYRTNESADLVVGIEAGADDYLTQAIQRARTAGAAARREPHHRVAGAACWPRGRRSASRPHCDAADRRFSTTRPF